MFEIKKGKSVYTKKYGDINKGSYPVYSASNIAPLTIINTFDLEGEFLTWATNGFAGYIKIINGQFSINGDRALLVPKIQNIDLGYVKNQIEPIFRNMAKGRKGESGQDEFTKVYPNMVIDVPIIIPVNANGEIDLETQIETSSKIKSIEEIKEKITEYKKQIQSINVKIANDYVFKNVKVDDIFTIVQGKALTQTFINSNIGEYPIYSSNTLNNGLLGMIKTFNHDLNGITWTTRGANAGTAFLREGRFSITNNCGLLSTKNNIIIDLDYIYSFLRSNLKYYTKGDSNKMLTANMIKNIEIPILINSKGEFDMEAQQEIAYKYQKIEEVKASVIVELEKLENIKVDLSF